MSSSPAPAAARPRLATTLLWAGWSLALACIFLRAVVGNEPFPYWDIDPTRLQTPSTGITPALSQIIDLLIMLGSAAALLGQALAGLPILLLPTLLALIGAGGVAAHSIGPLAALDDARIGSTWIAAIFAGLAAAHVGRDPRLRRITLAAAMGLISLLVAKGAVQVYVEHAQTVRSYRANPDAFLAAQGWSPGSTSARNFERRLFQAEATGWFGLANVFATFAAASLVSLLGWSLIAWRLARSSARGLPDGWAGLLTLGAGLGAWGLLLAGSKGGVTAAGIGLSLLAGGMLLGRAAGLGRLIAPPRRAGTLAVLLVLSAILAVGLRGIIGTRAGELSLLFRWYYMEGAARIMRAHPLLGVGPSGFKDAYMLAKPPLSPEEVSSPHSILFDFASTLGIFGLAWASLWLGWVYRVGIVAAEAFAPDPSPRFVAVPPASLAWTPERLDAWALAAIVALPTIAANWLERAMATPEAGLVRLVGLAGWIGIGFAALALMRAAPAWRWIAALGALTFAIHAQIEVTGIWAGSVALGMVILGAAGAPRAPTAGPRRPRAALPALMVLLAAGLWAGLTLPRTLRWEGHLARAAGAVSPLADLNARMQSLASPQGPIRQGDSPARILADLESMLKHPLPPGQSGFERGMDELLARQSPAAIDELTQAVNSAPRHLPTVEALCRLLLSRATALISLGQRPEALAIARIALAQAEAAEAIQPPTAGAAGLKANVIQAIMTFADSTEFRTGFQAALERGAALDPYGLTFPLRLLQYSLDHNDSAAAKHWAAKVLELDQLQRLDPLKRLTDQERAKAQRALQGT